MRRVALALSLLGSALVWGVVALVVAPLVAAMRSDNRARRESELVVDEDLLADDPGVDVDGCERCGEARAYAGARFCGAACSAASEMHR